MMTPASGAAGEGPSPRPRRKGGKSPGVSDTRGHPRRGQEGRISQPRTGTPILHHFRLAVKTDWCKVTLDKRFQT